jgi:Ca2+ transporting ATPase
MREREDIYGTNARRVVPTKSLWSLVVEQFEDRIL